MRSESGPIWYFKMNSRVRLSCSLRCCNVSQSDCYGWRGLFVTRCSSRNCRRLCINFWRFRRKCRFFPISGFPKNVPIRIHILRCLHAIEFLENELQKADVTVGYDPLCDSQKVQKLLWVILLGQRLECSSGFPAGEGKQEKTLSKLLDKIFALFPFFECFCSV